MAAVLDALASYVTGMLAEMAREEVAMLIGVSGEIDKLGVKLEDLKDLLADAERKRINDQRVQRWVRELKGAMYDASDILDLCHLKAMERPSQDVKGCLNPLLFCMRNPLHAHDIGSRIKALNEKLEDICKRGNAFSFIKLEAYQDQRMARRSNVADRRATDPVLEQSGVVGEKIEEDTRALVERMTTKEYNNARRLTVVAVVGVGGIGKTTLAKKVFNDEVIQQEFKKKIWLSVTQDFSGAELLRTAILAANGDLPRDGTREKALLVPSLVDAIRDKKFFLVLDDMWTDKEWKDLLRTPFSYGAAGSIVLVTTRDERVARGMQAMEPFHRVDKLGREDGWSLLKKQVATETDGPEIDSMLKDIGMEIVDKCDGLPLAVKVMGGLLCQREKQRVEWEKVLHDSTWSVSQMPQELNYTVYLSYEDMSPCLKQCFLHYSFLPKKNFFYKDRIIIMWISEGFLHGNSNDKEELGFDCYKELIMRNLIEPDPDFIDQCVCSMHDVVRSFAQYLVRDEALVAHNGEIDKTKLNSHKFLSLSAENKGSNSCELEWRLLREQNSLRTLISIGPLKIHPGDSLLILSRLRVLHIESAAFDALAKSLSELKHLRYVSLRNTDISRLPENIGMLTFLQCIDLDGCDGLVELPDSIVKLVQLRYIQLTRSGIKGIPRGFRGLTNLRAVRGFPANMSGDWCSVEELEPLSHLKLLWIDYLENVSAASLATKARLDKKVHLCELYLRCTSILGDDGIIEEGKGVPGEDQQRIEEVFDALCPTPHSLENLIIYGYFGQRVPRWMTSTSAEAYKRLRTVTLVDLACCTQLPDGLCWLPCLRFFQVVRAPAIKRVGDEFIKVQPSSPPRHHHAAAIPSPSLFQVAFPRLQIMELIGMVEWEEWEWELEQPAAANVTDVQQAMAMAMPVLEELFIKGCKLRHLPPGLASHARALSKLSVQEVQRLNSIEMFTSLVELFLSRNQDLERIAHLPSLHKLTIVFCPRLKALEGVPALQRLVLEDYNMEALPEYLLQDNVNLRHLLLDCSLELLAGIATGKDGPEWEKISRIQQVKAYADDGDNERKWYVLYTREPYSLETNITNHHYAQFGAASEEDDDDETA